MRVRARWQAGDTLVEVAIALAILAATLVTSFDIANRSYSEGSQAREQTQAIFLAQEQAEKLYYFRNTLVAAAGAWNGHNGVMNSGNFGVCGGSGCHFDPGSLALAGGPYTQPSLLDNITYYVTIGPLTGGSVLTGGANSDEAAFAITVTWNSGVSTGDVEASGNNENKTVLNLVLIDTRAITPRDCSVAGSPQCT